MLVSFCNHCGIANNRKDPVIHCLLRIFCDWASARLLSTLKSRCPFCYFFFLLTEAMFHLECCCSPSSIGYLLQAFLAGLISVLTQQHSKKHSGFVFSLWTCCCISEEVESVIFHFHSGFQQQQNWNRIADFCGFQKCSLRISQKLH